MRYFLGIDPGRSGALAAVDETGALVSRVKLSETEHDVSRWLCDHASLVELAILERVSAMPRQGVASTFKFGTSYGFVRGLLVAHELRFEEVTPAKWQQAMKCRSKGDKNVTKAAAQRLWPSEKITHAFADAMLLAEHARRTWALRHGASQ